MTEEVLLDLLKELHMLISFYDEAVPVEEIRECIQRTVDRLPA